MSDELLSVERASYICGAGAALAELLELLDSGASVGGSEDCDIVVARDGSTRVLGVYDMPSFVTSGWL